MRGRARGGPAEDAVQGRGAEASRREIRLAAGGTGRRRGLGEEGGGGGGVTTRSLPFCLLFVEKSSYVGCLTAVSFFCPLKEN